MQTESTTQTLGEIIAEGRKIALIEAKRRGLDHADADDAAQSVSIKLWQAIIKGQRIKSVEAWTRTATRNHIISQHRSDSRIKRGGGIVESLTDLTEDKFAAA